MQHHDRDDSHYLTWPARLDAGSGPAALTRALTERPAGAPLALHVQLPFCRQACRFCASQRVSSPDNRQAEPYLTRLDREMVLISRLRLDHPAVQRLHWGGGAPAFLSLNQMGDLFDRLDARFGLSGARERDFSIEIDPREADVFTLRHLQALGFNRLSLGVQELDLRVQKAINRIQPRVLTESLVDEAERLGFHSLNLDLIVGLPLQTPEGFGETLDQVIAMAPARITLRRYVHLPRRYRPQRGINKADLPDAAAQLAIMGEARDRLDAAGYVPFGLGQFARADDSLAMALEKGHLGRDLQGFTPCPTSDQVGLGVAAISRVGDTLTRNAMTLTDYEAALDASRLPADVGHRLDAVERMRRDAIEALACRHELNPSLLTKAHGLDATVALADALQRLTPLCEAGLLERHGECLRVTAEGVWSLAHLLDAFDSRASPMS
ncbi:oxygen-independent coproporphyrinogen III oxidase [Halomonas sp.]|uniref:oxygen-independent coproporphyrinogen III oxidase n=1 Tax=Halomonas sp. TaxID=1486246 RepID=UPI0025BD50A5|nr:oxygen-independent coproporphyrinogen III oxidase [Halomonas sp.]